MIEDAAAKGYETTCNIMAISKCQEKDIQAALEMIAKSSAKGVYVWIVMAHCIRFRFVKLWIHI
mgnify:CR=1 FL=1